MATVTSKSFGFIIKWTHNQVDPHIFCTYQCTYKMYILKAHIAKDCFICSLLCSCFPRLPTLSFQCPREPPREPAGGPPGAPQDAPRKHISNMFVFCLFYCVVLVARFVDFVFTFCLQHFYNIFTIFLQGKTWPFEGQKNSSPTKLIEK